MPKTDYYADPNAPKANSLVVAVAAVVRNDRGEILLIERTDNGLWALPGGAQEIGESVKDAVRREVREETAIEVEVTGLTGIYSDPAHVIAYDDGEVRRQFNICYTARVTVGDLAISDESTDIRFVAADELDRLPMHQTQRLRLSHFLEQRAQPYLG